MTRRIRIGLVVVALAAIAVATVLLLLNRSDSHSSSDSAPADLSDPLVVQFRETERNCITRFNDALARQRRNEIDELGLALVIDQEVLAPWTALRARLSAATPSPRNAQLYAALRNYVSARETAWQAYAAALRSPDAESRRHYDAYHASDAEADRLAREIGAVFRAAR